MKKINLFSIVSVALALTLASVPAMAQMSDDAVIAYVKDGMASGKSQNDLVKELAARGVTRAQAERLKERFENERAGQGGAVTVAGVQERQRRTEDVDAPSNAAEMDVIMAEVTEPGRRVFGRDIFTSRNLTFAPSANLPTPTNYVLGPGDEVFIDIWGTNQASIRQTISTIFTSFFMS